MQTIYLTLGLLENVLTETNKYVDIKSIYTRWLRLRIVNR